MHILIVPSEQYMAADNPLGGVFQVSQAEALAQAGHKVGVIAPKARSLRSIFRGLGRWQVGRAVAAEGDVAGYRYLGWSWAPERIPDLYIRSFRRTGHFLYGLYAARQGTPDLIHAHGSLYAGTLAASLQRDFGIPSVVTEHSSAYLTGTLRPWQLRAAGEAWRDAGARIVVSRALGKAIDREIPGPASAWEVIPNCLDRAFEEQDASFRRPGHEGRFEILSVGSLIPIKNHSALLVAFASEFRGRDGVCLSIVGDGPLRSRLEQSVADLHIRRQVTFLGQLDKPGVLRAMRACDLFVLPSLNETFGVVVIEALSCGRPVLATSCGGPDDIVTEGDGLLVRGTSAEVLAGGLRSCYESVERFDPSAIRRYCLERYGRGAITALLESVYHRVRSAG
jgi:glycosyltransferase involved in cell wall biosynthesis